MEHQLCMSNCKVVLQGYTSLVEVSTAQGQTIENNGLTAYSCLYWTVNILGHQCFINR